MAYTFAIYQSFEDLPSQWDDVVGRQNIMLTKNYFCSLESSLPDNMKCFYVGFFNAEELVGGALFQFLNFIQHKTFQKDEVLCNFKNFITRKLSRNVMILGNNMLTGQNGFYFDQIIAVRDALDLLSQSAYALQKKAGKTSLIIYKDYQKSFKQYFQNKNFKNYYKFSVQPNMILEIKSHWENFDDYLNAFSTKYRTRAKSAKKKLAGIEKSEMSLDDLKIYQKTMNVLYQNVAENAPFNTFFLPENHFVSMKECLKENLKVFGYYLNEKLIGFYTLILNKSDIDTYFLGYDKDLQKEKQIYLNMLLDMVEFGIKEKFGRIIFGRTALEIKSTIGAEPVEIFGLIKHNNLLINQLMERIFTSLNPVVEWIQRKPFK
ncbi:hypothetical protein CHRY9390_02117 [Chryseobacterium aquaeductus]|uniref:8-amino-7-oxononanoate synthase n=1 Tax=Chryseobacterium aquaeductus TaxID=2675056 RepID=A0A9N8MIJ4_9FLAO|nr:8-amino-7-oxononanoate synthase [Chryseobacterium aquaeductus]CAA7331416.1 hypothetical protein CHRY9390_02117 [Chryseobacterium potabilaquae]CAD7810073.1 hypothetical protein CHRY9390_02117 [Chryseobacterium aquaeductus]